MRALLSASLAKVTSNLRGFRVSSELLDRPGAEISLVLSSVLSLQRVDRSCHTSFPPQRQCVGSFSTSEPSILEASSGSARPVGAVGLFSEWSTDILCMLWSLWFEFGVSLEGTCLKRTPDLHAQIQGARQSPFSSEEGHPASPPSTGPLPWRPEGEGTQLGARLRLLMPVHSHHFRIFSKNTCKTYYRSGKTETKEGMSPRLEVRGWPQCECRTQALGIASRDEAESHEPKFREGITQRQLGLVCGIPELQG